MQFETGHLFHIYNQGNNRQRIFFKRENYLFFLQKIRNHLLPYADILAWCLMPNHFHIMVHVNELVLPKNVGDLGNIDGVTLSHPVNENGSKLNSLNNSIGTMLRSYTRAINKQENRTGSLFREECKAICLSKPIGLTPAWFTKAEITYINVGIAEKQYPNVCYNYILNNPVKDALVSHPDKWEFSSYLDITGKRNGSLVNFNRIREYGLVIMGTIDGVPQSYPVNANGKINTNT